ncbi:calcium-binding protein [Phenylobacterium sp.]|uniref:calcium-binding protein n=1 Tax=Phenylobacterium sp. TaxID=1871053 RepID=UPI002F92E368
MTDGVQWQPTVAMLPGGGWIVAWTSIVDGEAFIRAQRFDATGMKVGAEIAVSSTPAWVAQNATVAATADGGFVVAWASSAGPTYDVLVRAFASDGTALAPAAPVPGAATSFETEPHLAPLAGGNLSLAWTVQDFETPTAAGLRVAILQPDGTPGANFAVPSGGAQLAQPEVTELKDGTILVLWTRLSSDASGHDVLMQRFALGGAPLSSPEVVNTTAGGAQFAPHAAVLGDGSFVITWSHLPAEGPYNSDVFFQRFDPSGSRVGSETLASTSIAGNQEQQSVAALPNGGFLLVWQEGVHIFGRTFGPAGIADGPETKLSPPNFNTKSQADVAAGPRGYVVVWAEHQESGPLWDVRGYSVQLESPPPGEVITGTSNPDFLAGGDGPDTILAGGGSDHLVGGPGSDLLDGGPDGQFVDTADYSSSPSAVAVNLTSSSISVGSMILQPGQASDGFGGRDTLIGVEGLVGSSFGDLLLGSAVGNWFTPGLGNDTVDGGAGYDVVFFEGADTGVVVDLTAGTATGNGSDLLVSIEAVHGSRYNDHITLSAENNYVFARGGDDTLNGGGGDDQFIPGSGADQIDGGSGIDTVTYLDDTYDIFVPTHGVLVDLSGGYAIDNWGDRDTLVSVEQVTGSGFADQILGGSGAESLSGGGGADNIAGGAGNDLLDGGAGDDSIEGGAGRDTLQGGEGNDSLSGGEDHADVLRGGTGNDTLHGGAGDDGLHGQQGDDLLDGGDGVDVAVYLNANGGVTVDLAVLGYQAIGANQGADRLLSVEQLWGSNFADTLSGDAGANGLVGGAGGDLLVGREGDDGLLGEQGDDTALGGSGNDRLFGDAGNDSLEGGDGDDYFSGGSGDDVLAGGAGVDRAVYGFATSSGVSVSLAIAGPQNTGFGTDILISIEHLSGTNYADTLSGNGDDNWLWGLAGDDQLSGGGGNDLLSLGAGNAVADGGDGIDTANLRGTGAVDTNGITVSLAIQGSAQATGHGSVTLIAVENLSGSVNGDTLTGDAGTNLLAGDGGDDQLNGGGGDDVLAGDGKVYVDSAFTAPIVTRFTAPGVGGNDALDGGDGNDTLVGGGGADVLTGGAGRDVFLFTDLIDSGSTATDLIRDLEKKRDIIDLRQIDADTLAAGDQAFVVAKHGFTGRAGELFLEHDKALDITILRLDVDGDREADFILQLVGKHTDFDGFLL